VNVAFAAHYYDRREGTGGYVVEILTRVARRHDVTLYAAAARTPVPDGVRFVRVPALRGSAYATILSFPAAFAAVRGRHDIVHAQGWVTGTADVVTAHIVLAAWRRAARLAGVRPPLGERLLGRFVEGREARFFGAGARAIIAPSRKAARDIAECYGRTDGVHVVPHGFPAPGATADRAAARRRLGLDPLAFVALYVGDGRKGLAPAIEALALAGQAQLLVVGRSADAAFRALAERRGVAGRVHWSADGVSVAEAYAVADVLVHATIYDTFGLTVAEAMAAGLPVVVSREAGVTELITHGASGWIVDRPDGPTVAAALETLAADPVLRRTLGKAAQRVAAEWSWDRAAAATMAVYEAIRG
jgi:UDP-glucose:(heptosyl)LPS alpha-1,3-glucosyltransferase